VFFLDVSILEKKEQKDNKIVSICNVWRRRSRNKKHENPSVNNLEMLPKHQAKFISNSIFSLAKNLLLQMPNFITLEENSKKCLDFWQISG
jgi:hypothetical protein